MSVISAPVATPTCRTAPRPVLERLDRLLSGPMFVLAAVSLCLAAGLIHRFGHGDWSTFEATVILGGMLLVWPLIALEGVLRLLLCRRPDTSRFWRILAFVGTCALPPLRLGGRSYADADKIWLPGLGVTPVNQILRDRLERFFSVPILLMALLVLPLLAVEYYWLDLVRAHFILSLLLDVCTAIIWLAFAVELIVLVSVAEDKVMHGVRHWMEVAVVLLPLVEVLPVLRLFRLTGLFELQEVSRLGRLYRLRGLLSKAWRGILLLEMIERLFGNYQEKRLKRLRDMLAARQAEIDELRDEIRVLEQTLVQQQPPPS
jgi:hypothetical protein